ncbi:MAG: glycosyltransferase family 9 protein [Candidatus Promineifilaceae bacterium]
MFLRDNFWTILGAKIASIPFRLFSHHAFVPPKKALILKPCCISQVMLTTPLLAALSETYPQAQFDWAVSSWARPAIATNPRLSELVDTGQVGLAGQSRADVRELIERLRVEQYDTSFVPSRSTLLSYIAWRAGIPQRVGLNENGRGFAYTVAVQTRSDQEHEAVRYLSLAKAVGIESPAYMEFYPTDRDRSMVTALLVDEIDWLGDRPLVLVHPGGGENPVRTEESKRWPTERFALLANHLVQKMGVRLLLVGTEDDRSLADSVAGMSSAETPNLAGQLTLGQLGALAEMADLYIGNDAGSTHVAAAVGCPTLAIFGPSDPAVSGPFATKGRVLALRPKKVERPFSWEQGLMPDEVITGAEEFLGMKNGR